MTVEFRMAYNQLVCTWDEPKSMTYEGKKAIIKRRITRRIKLTSKGKIASGQLAKLGSQERWDTLIAEYERLKHEGTVRN